MTHENKDISELVPHENNPRRISKDQYARLEKTLEEFGDLSGVVFNSGNGKLVGGHMRTKVFKGLKSSIVITEKRKEPDEQGTIAWGFVKNGEKRYSYREVVWDEPKHEKAMLIANKAGGEFDFDMLANHWDVDFLVSEIGFEETEFGVSSYEGSNQEINVDEMDDNSTLKLQFTGEDYLEILERLNGIREGNESNESIFYKMLGAYEQKS